MIEALRQERLIVQQLFDGAAQLVETMGSGAGPGTVEVWVEGSPVAVGGSFQEAVAGTGSCPGSGTHYGGVPFRHFYTQGG